MAEVLHARIYDCRGYSSQSSTHTAHMGAGGTLQAVLGLESACEVCSQSVPPMSTMPPLYYSIKETPRTGRLMISLMFVHEIVRPKSCRKIM